ncbi:hypothetical protein [Neisseria sp.]|uniref:hypothetical protein n=1 Tax=Neisseria sp. TaxID=192066 RepID=UPI0035A03EC1
MKICACADWVGFGGRAGRLKTVFQTAFGLSSARPAACRCIWAVRMKRGGLVGTDVSDGLCMRAEWCVFDGADAVCCAEAQKITKKAADFQVFSRFFRKTVYL